MRHDITQFNYRNRVKGTYHSQCKKRSRELIKNHYTRNIPYYVKKARTRNHVIKLETNHRVIAYQLAHPCVDCGEKDPVVLDFDHIDERSKKANIGDMLRRRHAWAAFELEIKKCEVRCANCHRRRTAKRFGWYKHSAKQTDLISF